MVLFLSGAVIWGYFLAADYGMSFDILYQSLIGKYTQAYLSLENFLHPTPFNLPGHDKYYGSIHEFLIQAVISFFAKRGWEGTALQLTYWVNFSTFLLGVFFFYLLSRKYMREWVAFLLTLVFFFQPLLLGHAFINSKDIPFLSFFIASIFMGITMSEKLADSAGTSAIEGLNVGQFAWDEWRESRSKRKTLAIRFAQVWVIALLVLALFWRFFENAVGLLILQAFQADGGFLSGMFSQVAAQANTIDAEAYVHKGVILFSRFVKQGFGWSFLLPTGIAISALPQTIRHVWERVFKVYLQELFSTNYLRDLGRSLLNPWVFLAGVFAGLATAIRILGPAAAGLVVVVFLMRKKEKGLAPLTAYILFLILITYLMWPLLWSTGLGGFIQAFKVMAEFPWSGTTLFQGNFYLGTDLPRTYLPVLLSIQLTEPIVIGFFGSFFLVFWLYKQKKLEASLFWLLVLWFFLPLLGVILVRPTIYDNFRQFLFILPPLFIITGIGMDYFFKKARNRWVSFSVSVIMFLPAFFGIAQLHPYEYSYYNSFVGGVEGAFRQYETDYWITSMNEATEFLNENAPPNAKILVSGPYQNVRYYARADLEVFDIVKIKEDAFCKYDYAVLSTRGNADLNYMTGPILFQVQRGNAIFAVVREITHE